MPWSVARTQSQREAFAVDRLQERGFTVFAPKVETRRSVVYLFSNYLFVFIVDRWHAVDSTPGVLKLIRFGDCPARVPDAEIASLLGRVDKTGVIRLPPPPPAAPKRVFAKGARVKIIAGPFQGLAAVHSGMTVRDRELILLSVLGSQRPVVIAANLIVPH
jgi:transcriptional antiterminator RfaH